MIASYGVEEGHVQSWLKQPWNLYIFLMDSAFHFSSSWEKKSWHEFKCLKDGHKQNQIEEILPENSYSESNTAIMNSFAHPSFFPFFIVNSWVSCPTWTWGVFTFQILDWLASFLTIWCCLLLSVAWTLKCNGQIQTFYFIFFIFR